jgi:hypothetical protein
MLFLKMFEAISGQKMPKNLAKIHVFLNDDLKYHVLGLK